MKLTAVDNNWDPWTLTGYEANFKDERHPRKVRIISEEGISLLDVLKIIPGDLLQRAQDYFVQHSEYTLSTSICAMLGWPSSVTITNVSVRDKNNQKRPTERIEHILRYIRTSKEPWVWVEISSGLKDAAQTDYARHPILRLEKWVDGFGEQKEEYAKSLFAFLRRNHRCSRDFVDDLTALFEPWRSNILAFYHRQRLLSDIFDDKLEHIERRRGSLQTVRSLKSLAALLEDPASVQDARAICRLVRKRIVTCHEYRDELKEIYGPLHAAFNREEMERALKMTREFQDIEMEAEDLGFSG